MPMKSRELGSTALLLLFFVAFVGAAGAGYYFVTSGKLKVKLPEISLPVFFEKPRASEKDFTFIEDSLLRKHFVAQSNVRRYRTKTGADLSQIQEGILSDKEIRYHAKEKRNEKEAQLIRIGSTVYVYDSADGVWWKQSINPENAEITKEAEGHVPRDFKVEYQNKQGLTFTSAGEEACGQQSSGLTCYKYEEVNSDNAIAKRTFWFDKKSMLLRKEEVSFAGLTTVTEYEYNNISIGEPDTTKDIPEGGSVFAFFGGKNIQLSAEASVPDILGERLQQKLQEELDKDLQERLQKQLDQQLQKRLEERIQQQILQPTPTP